MYNEYIFIYTGASTPNLKDPANHLAITQRNKYRTTPKTNIFLYEKLYLNIFYIICIPLALAPRTSTFFT